MDQRKRNAEEWSANEEAHAPGAATSSPGGSPPGGAFGQAALAPTLEAPSPSLAPAAGPPSVPTATPTRSSSSAVGAGMGIAAALIGGGCLVVALLGIVGCGVAYWFLLDEPAAVRTVRTVRPVRTVRTYEPVPSPATPTPTPQGAAAGGDRYVVPLPASAPSRGAATAPLTIQIFSDFQCPFCARVNPTIAEIERNYEGRVRFVWRHLPLAFHADAMPAAEASVEVFTQGGDAAFWAYHDLLFENQPRLNTNNLVALAGRVPGVNRDGVSTALADQRHRARVQSDMDAVARAGMRVGTPSFLIGDRLLSGAQPYQRFASLIDAELAGR